MSEPAFEDFSTIYWFRKSKVQFSDPQHWVLVPRYWWNKYKKPLDLWMTKDPDLFGHPTIRPLEGFEEIAPSLFAFAGSSKEAEDRLREWGFKFKGVVE
jgi:hypothetical protein